MEREKNAMNQKTLKQLEKEIETIIASDSRISPFLNNISRNLVRDMSQQPVSTNQQISPSHNNGLILPKIN